MGGDAKGLFKRRVKRLELGVQWGVDSCFRRNDKRLRWTNMGGSSAKKRTMLTGFCFRRNDNDGALGEY